MPTKTYYKLVRDRIPEIIEADGKTCVCETLSDEDYLTLLDQKLNEELTEYQESKSLEELADLLEVMQAAVKARGWTLEDLERVRADKAAKRGGFEKKILLKEVREGAKQRSRPRWQQKSRHFTKYLRSWRRYFPAGTIRRMAI